MLLSVSLILALAATTSTTSSCDTIPRGDFCLCTTDSDCEGTCLAFREDIDDKQDGICMGVPPVVTQKLDPCDPAQRQNEPYSANDCILNSRRSNPDFPCDGSYYNLDLYTKNTAGGSTYYKAPMQCVIGYNILRVAGQTLQQCQQLCNDVSTCVAVEYGIDYGGAGLGTKEHTGCGMARTTTPGLGGLDQETKALTKAPTPAPSPPLLGDFEPCKDAEDCISDGCFDLQQAVRKLNLRASRSRSLQSSSTKTCANPASFQNSGPDSVCQFPFVFRGQTYSSCTRVGDADGRAWCSTKVDLTLGAEFRRHVSGGGFVHYCNAKQYQPTPEPTPPPTPYVPPTPAYVPVLPTPAPQPEIVYVPAPAPAPVYNYGGGGYYPSYGYDRGGLFGERGIGGCIGILCI